MVNQRALSQYQKVNSEASVENASPHKLIQMLMQLCLQRIAEAKGAIQRNDVSAKGVAIGRAIKVVMALRASLNKDVESSLPHQLDSLYDYMERRLVEANLKSSVEMLDEIAQLMRTVKEGWDRIELARAEAS